ncbi:MAG: hypothetical protein JXB85_11365 [Anaerolineales bacterium]|nr:hypothetical protein [Anaerolineales bacterium]
MSEQQGTFAKGDWIVHARYGIGQIEGQEKKVLDGKKQDFLKVKAFNCMYWLPLARLDAERIRPVTSEYRLQRALKLMAQPPADLPKDHHQRDKAVAEVFKDTSLYAMARMIRDLHARQSEARLNFIEDDALKKLKDQFLDEWSVVKNIARKTLEEKLSKILAASLQKKRQARK